MRRAGRLFGKIAEVDNLRLAFLKAARGKRHRPAVRQFEEHLDGNLAEMRTGLLAGRFEVGRRYCFTIHDPKPRTIHAAAFPERVMHHAVMNHADVVFECRQWPGSYACRRGKGRLAAVKEACRGARRNRWFLKADVRRFFDSISQEILLCQLERIFKDRLLLSLFERIIRVYELEPGRGLPIGNLTSQYFANHYLTVLDRGIAGMSRIAMGLRYMDDFLLFADRKEDLLEARATLSVILREQLRLEWKAEPYLNQCDRGVDFLGCRIFPDQVALSVASRKRLRKRCRSYEAMWRSGAWSEEVLQRRMVGLLSFPRHLSSCAWSGTVKGCWQVEV